MRGLLHRARTHAQDLLDDGKLNQSPQRPSQPPHRPASQPPPIPGQKPMSIQKDVQGTISEPTQNDVFRYRYHHGTNLGSIYVLEKWLHPSMFPEATSDQSSELEALKILVNKVGMDGARQKFEAHWANAISDDDLNWLVNIAKCSTIRLPIGYFTLFPYVSIPQSDPFYPYLSVYKNAWGSVLRLLQRLAVRNIGVLLDLHALPGGANTGDHSGTNSGVARFWGSASNRALGVKCCQFLAQATANGLPGVAGIQVCNEAVWEAGNMYPWYDDCISAVSAIDPSIPFIISDGWNLSKALDYATKKNAAYPACPTAPLIVDTHLYWAFTDADKAKTPQQIISEASNKLSELDGKEGDVLSRGAAEVIVGEYSCVLTEDSWAKCGSTPRQDLVRQFGQAQSQRFQSRAGGSFFWTFKMDWMDGGEWGFKAQSSGSPAAITAPAGAYLSDIPNRLSAANQQRDGLMRTAVNQHVGYWDQAAPGQAFEHWRYENGWKVGFQDAFAFFSKGSGSKIGCREVWILKRIRESGMQGGFVWEFEQGIRRGVGDFYGVVGV